MPSAAHCNGEIRLCFNKVCSARRLRWPLALLALWVPALHAAEHSRSSASETGTGGHAHHWLWHAPRHLGWLRVQAPSTDLKLSASQWRVPNSPAGYALNYFKKKVNQTAVPRLP